MPAEERSRVIRALRFALWAGANEGLGVAALAEEVPLELANPDAPGDLWALAVSLADLATTARRAIAESLGIDNPEGQAEFARGQLERELEGHEISASFTVVDAEFAAGTE